MTPEYAIQWPRSSASSLSVSGLSDKWCHSIVFEQDFCSEWTASHRATELALQLGCSTFHPHKHQIKQRRKPVGNASVSFCDDVDVFIGDFDSIQMHQIQVPAEALRTSNKPWSNRRTRTKHSVSLAQFDFATDIGCPVDILFAPFLHESRLQFPFSECPTLLQQPLQFCPDMLVQNARCMLGGVDPFTQSFVDAHFVSSPEDGFGIGSAIPQDSDAVVKLSACHEVCCDPLSLEAVLIPDPQHDVSIPASSQVRHVAKEHAPQDNASWMLRSPICGLSSGDPVAHPGQSGSAASSSESALHSSSLPLRPSVSNVPPGPQVPAFAVGILTDLPLDYQTNPVRIVRGILVRTWLLHHVTFPRSLQSRQCMLTGPPHTWKAQVLATWFGTAIPPDDVSIDLVKPNPPRN